MRRETVVTVLVCAAALTACTGPGEPAFVSDRPSLEPCGTVTLGQGETVPTEAWTCFDAAAATGAELVVSRPTTEGDPIVTYYRAGPGITGVEVLTDTTADAFGPRTWTHELCARMDGAHDPRDCRTV
ncbi:hypothetical protein [Cellulomonas sp. PhB150]|uniref:hypothetical protein n=1 Tax=Cellulomonas sp. PhB150 TaxID=2485188 RepID=UPI000F47725F|nr:hypothetical protein [Cellulomonas sp. PhB150]ROS31453.1 hypothetical protein EDF34_1112 [Cellulomonas sp. PhB150]